MPQNYPNGIGGSVGDVLAMARPLLTSGNVWYVNSAGGVDAASPAGQQRERPLATLAQAHTNAAAGDIIVLLSGHTQTLTAALTVNKAGLTIVGEGTVDGYPGAKLRGNSAAMTSILNCTAAGIKVRNILFQSHLQANSNPRVIFAAADCEIRGCTFLGDSNDAGAAVSLAAGANSMLLRSTSFLSQVTGATRPGSGVLSAAALSDIDIFDCVFDGGAVGFGGSSGTAIALDLSAGAVTRLRIESLSLLNGADYALHAATTGYVNVQSFTGGSRGAW